MRLNWKKKEKRAKSYLDKLQSITMMVGWILSATILCEAFHIKGFPYAIIICFQMIAYVYIYFVLLNTLQEERENVIRIYGYIAADEDDTLYFYNVKPLKMDGNYYPEDLYRVRVPYVIAPDVRETGPQKYMLILRRV